MNNYFPDRKYFISFFYTLYEEYENGRHFYKNRNYEEALTIFKSLAKKGHSGALHHLGVMYQKGLGVDINFKISFGYFIKAANKGHFLYLM